MKCLRTLTVATALLPGLALARWFHIPRDKPATVPSNGCEFTISSNGSFACPVGQLADGQIRLNGSYDTANFFLSDGGIVDSHGFGCIVTDPPTTQFQCDQGKTPTLGFSVDASNTLLYHGSSAFWVCPATDTEYNIYINPNFGQAKCFPITLTASACGAAASSSASPPAPPPPASTVWVTQTQTVTSDFIQTITVVETASPTCAASTTTSPVCKHCTETKSSTLSSWLSQTYASGQAGTATSLPDNTTITRRDLSTNPHWHQFSRRDLYSEWDAVKTATTIVIPGSNNDDGNADVGNNKWVDVGQVRFFPLDANSAGLRVATSSFYGCTVFVTVGTRGFYFGHLAQESGNGCVALRTATQTETQIVNKIATSPEVIRNGWSVLSPPGDGCRNRWAIIMGSVQDRTEDQGPYVLKDMFMESGFDSTPGVPPGNVFYTFYASSTAGSMADVTGPRGKALVTVDDGGTTEKNGVQMQVLVMKVYMSNDVPRLVLKFTVEDGQPLSDAEEGVTLALSDGTTDGYKEYP